MNVALIGLGTMGSGMATRLLKAGFALTVFNRTGKAPPDTKNIVFWMKIVLLVVCSNEYGNHGFRDERTE